MKEVAIRCESLSRRYRDILAVDSLSFEVFTGECFGLLGPNGAGKTTTVEILEGLARPDSGNVSVLGHSWGNKDDGSVRERMGVALQETRLPDRLTVKETLRVFRSFYSRGRSVAQVLDLLDLNSRQNSRVGKLSGGEKQRLALCCALISSPDILFLDEPTTGLDPGARLTIWEVVESFRNRGGTVLITTHYMEEAARLCDRIGIMDNGRMIALDTTQKLIESLDADNVIEIRTENGMDLNLLSNIDGIRGIVTRGNTAAIRVRGLDTVLRSILDKLGLSGTSVLSVSTHPVTLEDVFVHLTGREYRH